MAEYELKVIPSSTKPNGEVTVVIGYLADQDEISANDYHLAVYKELRGGRLGKRQWKAEGTIEGEGWIVRDYFDAPSQPGKYRIVARWTLDGETLAQLDTGLSVRD
ncbi:MAG: hypothetical protein NZ823_05990 [Blastocatellia bacterium]|nr:hypothetical protein [Blastocatellia bacterium]